MRLRKPKPSTEVKAIRLLFKDQAFDCFCVLGKMCSCESVNKSDEQAKEKAARRDREHQHIKDNYS